MDDNSRKRPLSVQSLIETVERVDKKPRAGSFGTGSATSNFSGQGIQLTGQGDFNVYRGNVNITTNNAAPTTAAGDCLRSLFITDPSDDRTALKRKKGNRAIGTCEWILETEELTAWLGQEQTSNILWLFGNPGIGKSTMAIFLTEKLSTIFSTINGNTLAYFFCDSSFDKRKTATSVIRGLLFQLVQQHRQLLDYVLPKYNERGPELFKSFDALWTVFMAAAADKKTGQKYCIIDALDECDRESQNIILQQFQETFLNQGAPSNIRILITSRPYSEIYEYLNEFTNKDLASYPQAEKDIDRCIEERVADLTKKKHYTNKVKQQVSNILREKAEGTFLWVGLACEELKEIPSKDAIRVLQNMPKGLHSLYKTLLNTAQEESGADTVRRILSLIAACMRPLSVLELSEACQLYEEEEDTETRVQFTRDQISSCRLMLIVQDEKVLLLHQSVKDYLVGASSGYFVDELEAHANIVYRCVNLLMEAFYGREQSSIHLFSYAIERWPDHARMAQSRFEIRDSEAEFFQVNSPSREYWLEALFDHWDYYGIPEDYDIPDDYEYPELYNIPRHMSILHIAGRWGIASLVDHITNYFCHENNTEKLDSSIDLDCVDSDNATPIELAVKWGSVSVISKLLCLGAEVNERVVTAAAKNQIDGKEIMTLLLNQYRDQITITEDIVKAAAGNYSNEVIALLLDRHGDQVIITEDIVKAAANIHTKEVIALLLNRYGDQITITEDIVKAAAEGGKEVMALLLDQRGHQITITEDIVKAAAGNYSNEVMALLLDHRGHQITITEDIVKAAAGNYSNEVMALLLDQRGHQITITEDIVKAAAGNYSNEVMALLLDRCGDQITITEDVIKAAANIHTKEVMALLLNRYGDQITITEDIVKAAARGEKEVMALLLDIRGDQIIITEDIVKAAAKNTFGLGMMALLLDRRRDQIIITEEVVKAAADNPFEEGVMELLFDQYGDQIAITEDVVKTAADGNAEVMAMLLDRRGDQIVITEDLVKAAAGNMSNGKRMMALLLDQRGDQITITEDIVKAAARNYGNNEVMALLLDRRGDQITITEDIIKAVAGNTTKGKEMIMLLLDRRGDQITITEDVVKAAATCGQDKVLDILSQENLIISDWDKWYRIAKFFNAAHDGDVHTIEQLLGQGADPDLKSDEGYTPLWVAAGNGCEAVVKVLVQRTDVNVNSRTSSGASPIFFASSFGHERVVAILIEAGADPRIVDKNGNTAAIEARRNGYERIAKILESVG
ncbi:hypothetical protein GGI35DRAFT_444828 [Trichoderma velutinum]